ncbi:MAG: biotin--[acetyl-CoA-carboxylase] ligase [Bacteroidales bacterium]|nr:biotin--[acetyl-CoA-carboxylase] ligase [Bacteroidales bacterium]
MIPKGPIQWYDVIDSTNSEVRRLLEQDKLDNLSVIAATCQTAGRGQGDHKWTSTPGDNLTFTTAMRFSTDGNGIEMPTSEMLQITCVTTLAIRDFLLDNGITARIKWPNDIWVGDLKICGILIENILEGTLVRDSIVGIGLNLNQESWPEGIPNPVSMKMLTGKSYEPHATLEALHEKLRLRFEQLATKEGRVDLDAEFRQYMFRLEA